jgi:hypothetical protein
MRKSDLFMLLNGCLFSLIASSFGYTLFTLEFWLICILGAGVGAVLYYISKD